MSREQDKLALIFVAEFIICWIGAFTFILGSINANRRSGTPKMTAFQQVMRPDHRGDLSAKRFLVAMGTGSVFWILAALLGSGK